MLLAAVNGLRDQVEASRLPLALPDAPAAGKVRLELLQQLDDYVIPRLSSLDAPLLAVVGGSTGAPVYVACSPAPRRTSEAGRTAYLERRAPTHALSARGG